VDQERGGERRRKKKRSIEGGKIRREESVVKSSISSLSVYNVFMSFFLLPPFFNLSFISVYCWFNLDEGPVELVTSFDEGGQVTDYCQLMYY
jgi:hypothetical protein